MVQQLMTVDSALGGGGCRTVSGQGTKSSERCRGWMEEDGF